ncbi:MAG: hypothetical protein GY866_23405 [Proteobacteria bacterium]|nr:hypothetical protein [Pseudomonadota bacterium]
MGNEENQSKKLKFSEWRPIGVCDSAPPGIQKAQMFTREDFLIITAPGVDRNNWRKKPDVMKVLSRYIKKLEKMSTLTKEMKRPTVSKISLVGAIMKLGVTPILNKESKDGKLQLFQIEFEDKNVEKKRRKVPWLVLSSLLGVALIVLASAFFLSDDGKTKRYRSRDSSVRILTRPYCQGSRNSGRYQTQLDEVRRILQFAINELYYQGGLSKKPDCTEELSSLADKEERFLECYLSLKNRDALSYIERSDLRNVRSCQKQLCDQETSNRSQFCY